jgi:hypothetical protein
MSRWEEAGRTLLAEASRSSEPGGGIRGAVGDALFACAFAGSDASVAQTALERAIADIEEHGTEVALHHGIAGLGLVVAMYRPDERDLLGLVDELTTSQLEALPPGSLQSGVPGLALYASVRGSAESGRGLQRAVVDRLRATAIAWRQGLVWPTPPSYADRRLVPKKGEPVVDLGMAHGLAGALVGLAALTARGDADARSLAGAGLAAAWSSARADGNRFGRIVFGEHGEDAEHEFGNSSWCAGDPGVLRALWLTARVVGDTHAAQRALTALRDEAARDARGEERLSGKVDLCCGAAAVAQLYLRMHGETGESIFREANTVLLARSAAGYERLEERSFQYGRMGVVLAQLAAERPEEPRWDAMLGMSLPR